MDCGLFKMEVKDTGGLAYVSVKIETYIFLCTVFVEFIHNE